MKDCTELAEQTLKSIFDPKSSGSFHENMEKLDHALSDRECQLKCSSNTSMERSAS